MDFNAAVMLVEQGGNDIRQAVHALQMWRAQSKTMKYEDLKNSMSRIGKDQVLRQSAFDRYDPFLLSHCCLLSCDNNEKDRPTNFFFFFFSFFYPKPYTYICPSYSAAVDSLIVTHIANIQLYVTVVASCSVVPKSTLWMNATSHFSLIIVSYLCYYSRTM